MYGGKVVVLACRQRIVVKVHPRCDQLGDAAFHEFLGQFRVFELFAYRHPLAGPYQPGQISVESVMGKTGEFHISGFTVCTSR